MTQHRQFPTLWQAILLLIFLFFILMFNGYLAILVGLSPENIAASPLVNAVINLLGFGLVIRLGFLRTEASFAEVFPFRRAPLLPLAAIFLAVCGLQILGSEMDNLVRSILPYFKDDSLANLFAKGNPLELIIFVVLLGPCYEEFLFRGLFLYGFARNYGKIKAIWLSACLFGLMHFDPARIIFAALFGAILGWIFLETHSLWPSIFGHALNNAMPFFLGLIPFAIPGFNRPSQGRFLGQPFWFDLLGLFLVAAGIFIIYKYFPHEADHPDHFGTI